MGVWLLDRSVVVLIRLQLRKVESKSGVGRPLFYVIQTGLALGLWLSYLCAMTDDFSSTRPSAPGAEYAEACLSLAGRLGACLAHRGWRVTTAESCTGGGIAAAITDVPGSSSWFEYGLVTYANRAKEALLGVPEDLLVKEGAVSEPVVNAMAIGALRVSGANLAVAVSGIAGPDGGSPGKPVGTVWLAWACLDCGQPRVKTLRREFSGARRAVRAQTVLCALEGLIELSE